MNNDSIYWKIKYTNDGSGIAEKVKIIYNVILLKNGQYQYRKVGVDITNKVTTLGLTGNGDNGQFILTKDKSIDINHLYFLIRIHYENGLANFVKDDYATYILQMNPTPIFASVDINKIPDLLKFINDNKIPHFAKK